MSHVDPMRITACFQGLLRSERMKSGVMEETQFLGQKMYRRTG
jgi:hypothetical protein